LMVAVPLCFVVNCKDKFMKIREIDG